MKKYSSISLKIINIRGNIVSSSPPEETKIQYYEGFSYGEFAPDRRDFDEE